MLHTAHNSLGKKEERKKIDCFPLKVLTFRGGFS